MLREWQNEPAEILFVANSEELSDPPLAQAYGFS